LPSGVWSDFRQNESFLSTRFTRRCGLDRAVDKIQSMEATGFQIFVTEFADLCRPNPVPLIIDIYSTAIGKSRFLRSSPFLRGVKDARSKACFNP